MTTNLERWRYFLKDVESPDLFINWTFYATVSAALERRVCFKRWPHIDFGRPLFANLYIIFIGPPGVGKSTAAAWSVDMFRTFGGFDNLENLSKRPINVAPSSTSLEGLYRFMVENARTMKLQEDWITKSGDPKKYCISSPIAFFAVDELATLFREQTDDVVNFLSQGFDCGDFHRQTKTQGVDFIKNMSVMLLGCATPDWVKTVSRNGLLKQGFAARTIFVWGGKKRHLCATPEYTPEQMTHFRVIKEHIGKLLKLYGPVEPTPEAQAWINEWYTSGGEELPEGKNKILIDYYARRRAHLIKLAMVMHFADSLTLEITVEDCKRALALLEATEFEMHMALLGQVADNPASRVATLVLHNMERLQVNGAWVKEAYLLHEVFDECIEGRATFDEAMTYLLDVGKLVKEPREGKMSYRLSTKPLTPTTH